MTGSAGLRYGRLFGSDASRVMENVNRRARDLAKALGAIVQFAEAFDRLPQVTATLVSPLVEEKDRTGRQPREVYRIDAPASDADEQELVRRFEAGRVGFWIGGSDKASARNVKASIVDGSERLVEADGLIGEIIRLEPQPSVAKRMRGALYELQNAPTLGDIPLLRLFDDHSVATWPTIRQDSSVIDWSVLTDDSISGTDQQRQFVRTALGSDDFTLLEGPPGSGKTTAIIELITQAIRRGQRVLLVAPTHVAVDNVLERLEKIGAFDKEGILPVRIRSGTNRMESTEYLLEENQVEEFGSRIGNHLGGLPEESHSESQRLLNALITSRGDELADALLAASNLVCGTTMGVLSSRMFRDEGAERSFEGEESFDLMILDEASKTTLPEFLVPALRARRWVLVGDVRQLSPTPGPEIAAVLADRVVNELRTSKSQTHSEDVRESLVAGLRALGPRRSGADLDPEILDNEDLIDIWAEELAWRLGNAHPLRGDPELASSLLAEISGLTCGESSRVQEVIDTAIDTVRGVSLSSILESVELGIGRRGFQAACALSDGLPAAVLAERRISLTYQHRMHPEISRFPRDEFYDGTRLIDAQGIEARRPWCVGGHQQRVVWIGTKAGDQDQIEDAVRSQVEAVEQWTLRERLSCSLAIISPYREQVTLIRQKVLWPLSGRRDRHTSFSLASNLIDCTLGTVDSFQGQEADFVIFVIGKDHETSFTRSPNRINVALTRARHQLFVVGFHRGFAERGSGSLGRLAVATPVEYQWRAQ